MKKSSKMNNELKKLDHSYAYAIEQAMKSDDDRLEKLGISYNLVEQALRQMGLVETAKKFNKYIVRG